MKKIRKFIKKNNFTLILIFSLVVILVLFFVYRGHLNEYPNSSFRNVLEIIYFISSSLLLVVGAFGLKQIRIAKDSSKLNATRESYKLAAEQCTYFLNHIIPLTHQLDALLEAKSIKNTGEVKTHYKDNQVSFEVKLNKELISCTEVVVEMSKILNSIEAFSVFFTSRVAEEEVAFSSIGRTYCTTLEDLLPIAIAGSRGGEKGYSNLIKLYIAWNHRIEQGNALRDKIKAEQKLNQSITVNLKSLGT
jgi:hypothetical protein